MFERNFVMVLRSLIQINWIVFSVKYVEAHVIAVVVLISLSS